MAVVTIARQLGAGGGAIADQLAGRLHWQLLDRELVEQIAQELGVTAEEVRRSDERPETIIERIGQYLAEGFPEVLPASLRSTASPDATAAAAHRVISRSARTQPAVVVGHGAQCVLGDHPDAFHVLLHAPTAVRSQRAAHLYRITREEAERRIRQSDLERQHYIEEHFGRDWMDPGLYHLCIDTSRMGVSGSVDVIARGARHLMEGRAGLGLDPEEEA